MTIPAPEFEQENNEIIDRAIRANVTINGLDARGLWVDPSLDVSRNTPALREIVFGHVTPAFLVARRKRKTYLSPRGGDGTVDRAVWQP